MLKNKLNKFKFRFNQATKIVLLVGIFFVLLLAVNYIYLYLTTYNQIKNTLKQEIADVERGDSNLINKGNPFYLIYNDGYSAIVDNPINGYLDSSSIDFNDRYKNLGAFTSPETKQTYRLLSKDIIRNDTVVANVLAGYPTGGLGLPEISTYDSYLTYLTTFISDKLPYSNNQLNTKVLKNFFPPPGFGMRIVDPYNKVLYSTLSLLPSYIDTSYIDNLHNNLNQFQVIKDAKTGNPFLVYSDRFSIGNLVVGYPLKQVQIDLTNQLVFSIAAGSIMLLTLLIVLIITLKKQNEGLVSLEEALRKGEGQNVEFKEGIIDRIIANVIASFSNTNSGNIFLGINDNGNVVGLTIKTVKEKDLLLHKIREITTDVIKPTVLPTVNFIDYGGKLVLHIFVPRGDQALYFVDGVVYTRHVNSVLKARPEEVESILKKFYRR